MGWFSKRVEKRISLYSIILNALDEHGRLPRDFSLQHDTPDNQIRFAPGAMDGIGIFHVAGRMLMKGGTTCRSVGESLQTIRR